MRSIFGNLCLLGVLLAGCGSRLTEEEREQLAAYRDLKQALDEGAAVTARDPTDPVKTLLAGGRKEWMAADSATQTEAMKRVILKAHPDWDSRQDFGFEVGFLTGRVFLIYDQRTVEELATTLDALRHEPPR